MKQRQLTVTYKRVEDLIPYVNNARTHSDDQVTQIASSIKEFGFNNPILTDGENGVIAGHGRLLAAKKLGLETVPTIELSGLSEAQKKAYILADNKIALNSGWDEELLKIELDDLQLQGIDLETVGFSAEELQNIIPPLF
jgi:ParB-like chromosome segregation protein Spo0J